MRKVKLSDDVFSYHFSYAPEIDFDVSVTVIFDGEDFVMIDTAYEHNMEELKKELDFSKCKYIIFTHYHPDHILGRFSLPDIPIIGSDMYESSVEDIKTFEQWSKYDYSKVIPKIIVNDIKKFKFGKHEFTFIKNPGHAQCSMLIDLNNEFLFTGDDLIFVNNGELIAPIYFTENLDKIRETYDRLLQYGLNKTIVPSHGPIIESNSSFEEIIKKCKLYLELVLKGIPFEQLEEEGFPSVKFFEFHNMNLDTFKNSVQNVISN